MNIKVERAKKHFDELKVELQAFVETKPFRIEATRNPQTRRPTYTLVEAQPVPESIAAIVGDILHNLKSALDHLRVQLGKAKGKQPEAQKALGAIHPYEGGNKALWRIHELDKIDKHIILLSTGVNPSVDLGAVTFQHLIDAHPAFAQVEPIHGFFTVSPPLKVGDVVFEDAPDARMNPNLFWCRAEFAEPNIIENEPLVETLQAMICEVEKLVDSLAPLLA
jgi:hypothetical protein